MQIFSSGDSTFDLTRKILQNQTDIAAAITAGGSSGGASSGSLTTGADITVAVAGTAVQGASAAATKGVLVVARGDNAGTVYVGGSNVSNASGSRKGIQLSQLGMPSQFIEVDNANKIWVNADNAGDSVGIIVL